MASRDPVCGKEVDELRARAVAIYGKRTFYFCSAEHKAEFGRDPARYMAEGAVVATGKGDKRKSPTPLRGSPAPEPVKPERSAPAVVVKTERSAPVVTVKTERSAPVAATTTEPPAAAPASSGVVRSEQPETATEVVEPLPAEAPRGGSRLLLVIGAVGLVVAAIVLWLVTRK